MSSMEVQLRLKAKDDASRQIRRVGQSLKDLRGVAAAWG